MPHTIAYWHRSDLEAELPDAAELEVMTLSCKKGTFSDIYDGKLLGQITHETHTVVSTLLKKDSKHYLFQLFTFNRSITLPSIAPKVRLVKVLSERNKSPQPTRCDLLVRAQRYRKGADGIYVDSSYCKSQASSRIHRKSN